MGNFEMRTAAARKEIEEIIKPMYFSDVIDISDLVSDEDAAKPSKRILTKLSTSSGAPKLSANETILIESDDEKPLKFDYAISKNKQSSSCSFMETSEAIRTSGNGDLISEKIENAASPMEMEVDDAVSYEAISKLVESANKSEKINEHKPSLAAKTSPTSDPLEPIGFTSSVKTPMVNLLDDLTEYCSTVDKSHEMKIIIRSLTKRVSKLDEEFKKSKKLQDLLATTFDNVKKSPDLFFKHLEDCFKQLDSLYKIKEEPKACPTAALDENQRKTAIKRLKEGFAHLTNEEADEEGRIQHRCEQIYIKIEELTGDTSSKPSYVYKGSQHRQFNKYVTKLIQSDTFVGIDPIVKRLKTQNVKHNFGLDDNQMTDVASKAYKHIVEKKRTLRWKKLVKKSKLFTECDFQADPAIEDSELFRKLSENAAENKLRMTQALAKQITVVQQET